MHLAVITKILIEQSVMGLHFSPASGLLPALYGPVQWHHKRKIVARMSKDGVMHRDKATNTLHTKLFMSCRHTSKGLWFALVVSS